ncbi:MAG: hypothetical protein ABIT83_17565 [Massilia sp.]
MSVVVGERDRLLQATVTRNINPTLGKFLLLSADPQVYHLDSEGVAISETITVTAHPLNIPGAVLWAATGCTLAGGGDNVRTIAAMQADKAVITAQITHEGQPYLAKVTITTVRDGVKGADGSDGDSPDLSPAALKSALEGQITEAELYATLQDKITLITAPESVAGGVSARVKAETDARVDALAQEAANRTTYVQSYTYSKAAVDQSLSIQASTIASAYTAYADAQRAAAIGAAAADVRSYAYSKSSTDGALASQSAALTASYTAYANGVRDAAIGDAAADVRNYAYSKSSTDGALASQSAALTAGYTAYANGARDAAISAAAADVRSYSYSKASTDSAIASSESALRSEFLSSGGATEAYVQGYAYSKATIDSAFASQFSALSVNYSGYADTKKNEAIAAAAADVRSYSYSKASVDGAIASSTTELSSTVGNHTTTIQAHADSINGLGGQLTWKIDNNGYVTGIGLASTVVNGTPSSSCIIYSDRFAIVAPGLAPKLMFGVGNVAGQTAIGINGALMIDGTLVMRNTAGTVILAAGVPLHPLYAADGTLNSELLITENNAADHFEAGALDGTYIKNLSADKINVGLLSVDRIADGALVNRFFHERLDRVILETSVDVVLIELSVVSPYSGSWSGEISAGFQIWNNDSPTFITYITLRVEGHDTLTDTWFNLGERVHSFAPSTGWTGNGSNIQFAAINIITNWRQTMPVWVDGGEGGYVLEDHFVVFDKVRLSANGGGHYVFIETANIGATSYKK